MPQKKTLTIIDTFGFFFRSFYALPPLKNKDGFPTGLLTGFMNFVYSIGRDYTSDYIVFALDAKGKSFRNEIYKEYKANRSEAPEDLKKQLPIAIQWIEKMGFASLSKVGFEADDIIASLAHTLASDTLDVIVVSHDKDLYQLINDKTYLFDPIKKTKIDEKACLNKYNVLPEQFTDFQSIVGDSSDNVPGVKGIGEKGASKLLSEFKTLDRIFDNINLVSPPRSKKLLEESKESAYMSKKLVSLSKNIYDSVDINDFHIPTINPILAIQKELIEYNITSILDKVKNEGLYIKTKVSSNNKSFESILLNDEKRLFEIIQSIKNDQLVALDTETTSLNSLSADIVGFSFSFEKDKAYYVPIEHSMASKKQISKKVAKKAILQLLDKKILGHNLKYDMQILKHNFNIEYFTPFADTIIMAWLLNPSTNNGLDSQAKVYFSYEMTKFKDIVKKGDNFANVDIDIAVKYASEDAWMSLKLYHKFETLLDDDILNNARTLEYPFIKTLSFMEELGIKVDIKSFKDFDKEISSVLYDLTNTIHEIAGESFNINSPKQLSGILFDKLNLPVIKKTKTGYSTNEAILKKLQNKHKIIDKILEYRELHKLSSTYVKPLIEIGMKSPNNRIHTSFLQFGTSTGRLSSKSPNLQNIPTRSKLGRQVRNGFIAKEGHKLISIDYSQIELRLLAHFSKDAYLLECFHNDLDIHTQTAKKLFPDDYESKRHIAKTINFGILYGMGSRKLAETLKITVKEAKNYINSYFDGFKNVRSTINDIQELTQEQGFIETLLKRKRYFNFKEATAFEASGYMRECVNTVFQGSAADLIKLSMNKIHTYLENKPSKMLLQIHDEIIIESNINECDEVLKDVVNIMENIFVLEVPLKVSASIGDNWGSLK